MKTLVASGALQSFDIVSRYIFRLLIVTLFIADEAAKRNTQKIFWFLFHFFQYDAKWLSLILTMNLIERFCHLSPFSPLSQILHMGPPTAHAATTTTKISCHTYLLSHYLQSLLHPQAYPPSVSNRASGGFGCMSCFVEENGCVEDTL